jgi:hypothetical protein
MSLLALSYKKQFAIARKAKLGQPRKQAPHLEKLRSWIADRFNVNVLDVGLEHVEPGPATGVPRLRVILETDREFNSWHPESFIKIRPEIKRRILRELLSMAQNHAVAEDLSRTFLIVDSFEDACLDLAGMRFHDGPARPLARKLAPHPVWRVDGFCRDNVVFLYTEQDVRAAKRSRWGTEIKRQCFEGNKKYDEFGYLTEKSFHFKFDSKENLDKNYGGNLFLYWK